MADAVARLTMDASGLTKGAQEAYNAFSRFIKADQQVCNQLQKEAGYCVYGIGYRRDQ